MIVLRTMDALGAFIQSRDSYRESSGFVPTMGALHAGHLSLIEKSKQDNCYTVASIFVNPTQFNNSDDFEKYPITVPADLEMLEDAGCDLVFLPTVAEMYPEGTAHLETYALGELENRLEGFYRPGHFQGVCQVVYRLLKMVQPTTLYLGQKDFQQVMVISKMIELTGLGVGVQTVPTMREPNGLAMSSRNMRLSATDFSKAAAIYQQLQMIKSNKEHTAPDELKKTAQQNLLDAGFEKVDYVEIAEPATLETVRNFDNGMPAVALVAAYMGDVRLIDNLILL